jgi:hypothetical protein
MICFESVIIVAVGRKLRCSGQRPNCDACDQRKQECFYEANAPRRRGPGKAPKGTRSKRRATKSKRAQSGAEFGSPEVFDDRDRLRPEYARWVESPHGVPYYRRVDDSDDDEGERRPAKRRRKAEG